MTLSPEEQKVWDYLCNHPKGVSIKELRETLWIQNIPDTVMRLRKKGKAVETFKIRTTENGKSVNGYRVTLMEWAKHNMTVNSPEPSDLSVTQIVEALEKIEPAAYWPVSEQVRIENERRKFAEERNNPLQGRLL